MKNSKFWIVSMFLCSVVSNQAFAQDIDSWVTKKAGFSAEITIATEQNGVEKTFFKAKVKPRYLECGSLINTEDVADRLASHLVWKETSALKDANNANSTNSDELVVCQLRHSVRLINDYGISLTKFTLQVDEPREMAEGLSGYQFSWTSEHIYPENVFYPYTQISPKSRDLSYEELDAARIALSKISECNVTFEHRTCPGS